jgi:hypothetical protein
LVRKEAQMSELEARHYLANGAETRTDGRDALDWAAETRAQMVDRKVGVPRVQPDSGTKAVLSRRLRDGGR